MKTWRDRLHSAYHKIAAAVLLVCVAVVAFNLYASVFAVRQVQRQAMRDKADVAALYRQQLDNSLSLSFIQCTNLFSNETEYLRLANPMQGESQDQITLCQKEVWDELRNVLYNFSAISGAFAYFPERELLVCARSGISTRMTLELNQMDEEGLTALFPQKWSVVELDEEPYLAVLRPYRNGYYGLWVKWDELMSDWGLNGEGTDRYGIGTGEYLLSEEKSLDELAAMQGERGYTALGDRNYVVLRSQTGDFYLYNAVDRTETDRLRSSVVIFVCAAAVLAVLAGPVLLRYLRRVIVRPVNALVEGMRQVEEGNTDYRIPEQKSSQEFERLDRHFNHMLDRVQELKLDVYQGELQRSEIRMRYLSQQIQPHFILNTLNLIYSYEPEEYDYIQKLILCLSRYYRYIISSNEHFVPLEGELEHIQNYFDIQRARYPGFFQAEIMNNAPEDGKIPPLSIQPFAENFIKYAINGDEKVEIHILAEPAPENRIRVSIWDNSQGFTPAVLEEIQAFQESGRIGEHLGVGIRNVIERLDLLYGGQAEIRFANRPAGGASVTMEMPKESEVSKEWKL